MRIIAYRAGHQVVLDRIADFINISQQPGTSMGFFERARVKELRNQIRRFEIAINSKRPGMFSNYFESLRSRNDIAISIAIAGLAYTCAITLGSGSYLDLLGNFKSLDWIIWVILLISTAIFAITSGLTIFAYILHLTKIDRMDDRIKIDRLLYYRDIGLFGILFCVIGLSFVIILYGVGVNIHLLQLATLIICIIMALFTILAVASYFTYDVLKAGWRQFTSLTLILFVSSMLYINAYRDAEKSATITDGRYCYWLKRTASADVFSTDPTCR